MKLIRKFYKLNIFLICCILTSNLFLGCTVKNMTPVSQTGFYFDTVITITLYSSDDEDILNSCFELASIYENMLSRTKEGSDIYRINNANGAPTEVSPETAELLQTALDYAASTDGVVDPTIGTVSALWDFHEDAQHIPPTQSDITSALSHVNYKNVLISGNTVTLSDSHCRLDLGFIAKGYIADKIKEHLLNGGVTSAIINLGGNVLTIGTKPDGTPFNVGIQEPFADTGTPITVVSANDISVVSSGIYERYYEYDGTLYHHILDTKSGYPVNTDLLGVSILSESSTDGDALSTICLALGYEKANALINSLENVDAIFITNEGNVHRTD